jgi:hypothetical protein
MKINEYYLNSIGKSREEFVDFVKINYPEEGNLDDIDFLVHRVALNLFVYESNLNTAKTDYIALISLLIQKGVVFENIQDLGKVN